MKSYLRKYELMSYLDLGKTTLTRWIRYFEDFIPIYQQGDVECYGHEAKDVLMRVKILRKQLYSLPHIKKILTEENFQKFNKSNL